MKFGRKESPPRMVRSDHVDTRKNLQLIDDGLKGGLDAMAEYEQTMQEQTSAEALEDLRQTYEMYPELVVEKLAEEGLDEKDFRKMLGYDQENN